MGVGGCPGQMRWNDEPVDYVHLGTCANAEYERTVFREENAPATVPANAPRFQWATPD